MRLQLVCVGKQTSNWVTDGFNQYWQRLVSPLQPICIEINTVKRSKTKAIDGLKEQEAKAILKTISQDSHCVMLDESGTLWDTSQLAKQMQQWLELAKTTTLVIGGPDGLAPSCLTRANQVWSLSPLTLPHPLVRILVAEQLYRAQSILANHPYHRA